MNLGIEIIICLLVVIAILLAIVADNVIHIKKDLKK